MVLVNYLVYAEDELFLATYSTPDGWVGYYDSVTMRNKQFTLSGVGYVLLF